MNLPLGGGGGVATGGMDSEWTRHWGGGGGVATGGMDSEWTRHWGGGGVATGGMDSEWTRHWVLICLEYWRMHQLFRALMDVWAYQSI